MNRELGRIRGIANYQFGPGSGSALFPDSVLIDYSRKTGKIRHVRIGDLLVASLRPTDGLFTLTIFGAERLISSNLIDYSVTVMDEVSEFVSQGKNVFAKHVIAAGEKIRPGDEVVVLDQKKRVIGVGRALLTREEMLTFKVGVAVKTRRGKNRDK
jgi:predicted RNA-binding protein (TIGR00451 family)